jgi:ankyrin repeat protein
MHRLRSSNRIVGTMAAVVLFLCLAAPLGKAEEIHVAVTAGDLSKVRALIDAEPAQLEMKDKDGNTPLIIACATEQVAIANYLIDRGADVNAKGALGATPLMAIRKDREWSFGLAQRLVAKGADVNAAMSFTFRNWTVLCGTVKSGNVQIAKLLIEHGADLNIHDIEGTPLQMAISNLNAKEEMAKLLIESGAKLQAFSYGNTELHLAAMKGFAELVPLLVSHGADVNAVNDYNRTALYYAAMHGHRKTADALLAAGAKIEDIVEINYGKPAQLAAELKEGEAWLWYLGGGSPCDGYAVKTKEHLLIFNPFGVSESPEAGLSNGYLKPSELEGQKIIVLINHRSGPSLSELAKALPNATFVLNYDPSTDDRNHGDLPHYRRATPNESFSISGIQVHAIPAMLRVFFEREGLGYLVEADGVKIFHPGLHVSSNQESKLAMYRKEIDFLKPFGPIDIAILPIKGRHINLDYEPYLYLIDQLSPRAIYLIGDDLVGDEHKKCAEVLGARDIPMAYPQGGIAMGERFHYLRSAAPKWE